MLIAIITLLFALAVLLGYRARRRMNDTSRDRLDQAVKENGTLLLSLLALLALPAVLLLPQPLWVPRWAIVGPSLLLWALLLIAHWESRVVPADRLRARTTAPYRPRLVPQPVPAPSGTPGPTGVPGANGDIIKQFRWTFTGSDGQPRPMTVDLSLNSNRYEGARVEPRRSAGDWAHYAVKDMPELDDLAAEFYRLHKDRGWSTLERASNVLCFTQSCIVYALDEETAPGVEWPRYPIETLVDELGDCEDDVILTAAVLKRLGFDVALLYYQGGGTSPGHCALGLVGAAGLPGQYVTVRDGQDETHYFYGETTAQGWLLGEVPEKYRGLQPDKIEKVTRPIPS